MLNKLHRQHNIEKLASFGIMAGRIKGSPYTPQYDSAVMHGKFHGGPSWVPHDTEGH